MKTAQNSLGLIGAIFELIFSIIKLVSKKIGVLLCQKKKQNIQH